MSTVIKEATIEDLYKVEGKAEIINGEIVLMPPTGFIPNRGASNIYSSLREHEKNVPDGLAVSDNMAFEVNLSHRKTLSPDAAFFTGKPSMKFAKGAPLFAVEVRNENDYGKTQEREMKTKRDDYFACGTLVVWDVDMLSDAAPIKSYDANNPDTPRVFRRGGIADAELALPGWRFAVDELFR
ncbi:MAG: Uma2 family endonuclease [Pyrinomonadaceae bacterium MAG19_C2-C3]|nr:Uma2 family endonuclease [Pyrinomonadaceae bacterium MAG19_C2-C3]